MSDQDQTPGPQAQDPKETPTAETGSTTTEHNADPTEPTGETDAVQESGTTTDGDTSTGSGPDPEGEAGAAGGEWEFDVETTYSSRVAGTG